MKRILLVLVLFSSTAFSANDLEKWNGEVSKNIRKEHSEQLAKTTYKEISSKAVNSSSVSNDLKNVTLQIESKATVAGSKSRVVAEAILEVDKSKVGKYWKKFIKGAGVIGTALMVKDLILDSLDYIMGDGGQIIKRPSEEDIKMHTQEKIYMAGSGSQYPTGYGSTILSAGSVYCRGAGYTFDGKMFDRSTYSCKRPDGVYVFSFSIVQRANPSYDPNYKPEIIPVLPQQLDNDIDDILNNPDKKDLAKNLIKEAYNFSSINDDNKEIARDVSNRQKSIVDSDNPVASNKSSSVPRVESGNEAKSESETKTESTTQVNENTKTNPDGSTSTTGTNVTNTTNITTTNFEFPAFCTWASIVCDFIDWFKKEPEIDNPSVPYHELEEQEIKKDLLDTSGRSCPRDLTVNWDIPFKGRFSHLHQMQPICDKIEPLKYAFLLCTSALCAFILLRV